jgi:hypothetical protein
MGWQYLLWKERCIKMASSLCFSRNSRLLLVLVLFLSFLPCNQINAADVFTQIPGDIDFILTVDVAKILASRHYKVMEAEMMKDDLRKAKYEFFVKTTGIDPARDIQSAHLFLKAPEKAAAKSDVAVKPEIAILVKGNFKADSILPILKVKMAEKKIDIKEETYNGIRMWHGKNNRGEEMGFAFLNDGSSVLGNTDMLRTVMDLSVSKDKNPVNLYANSSLMGLVKPMIGQKMVWMAANLPQGAKEAAAANPRMQIFKSVESITFTLDVEENFAAVLKVLASGEKEASEVFGVLNGYLMMGRMLAGAKPLVGELLKNLTASVEGVTTMVDFTVKFDDLKAVIEKVRNMGQAMGNSSAPAPASTPAPVSAPSDTDEGASIK